MYRRALMDAGQAAEAEAPLRDAHDSWTNTIPEPNWRPALAAGELSMCLAALGRAQEARTLFAGALPVLMQTMGTAHPRVKRFQAASQRLNR